MNKTIHRDTDSSAKIFDDRTLERDYSTLVPAIRRGMRVLDVGCGTGAISSGIAALVGQGGFVTGIDNTEAFIKSGQSTYKSIDNLSLIHADLFHFDPTDKFDLVVAARVLQWMSNPAEAIKRLISFVKPGGQLSILDYNHELLQWKPQPPESMLVFYDAFLKWRASAGMDNRIADRLPSYFADAGLDQVVVLPADETYRRGERDFLQRVGIWSKVAGLKQIVDEGFLEERIRLQAIADYERWVERDAQEMIMKLTEVRGSVAG